MPALSKQQINAKSRRLFLKREPLNLSAVKRRDPELVETVNAMRHFWGWKQALEDAGIDYARIPVELEDDFTCLICGAEAAIASSHEDLQLLNATRRRYGSYENALLAAGIDPGMVGAESPRHSPSPG